MTNLRQSLSIEVQDDTQVGAARRSAKRMAVRLGLPEVLVEQAAIAATEAARNLVQHARGGEILLRPLTGGGGLELLALDRGPGVRDLGRAMEDGYSTAGTAGQGLGAMARLASEFDAYTVPGHGTAVLVRIGDVGPDADVGAVCVAVGSERRCGDAWTVARTARGATALLVDGLGHGEHAADAAEIAVTSCRDNAALPATALLEAVHAALRPTRGAAVAVAQLPLDGGPLQYAGIGNVAGALAGAGSARTLVSLPGTAGHQIRRIQPFDYAWPDGALLVMHSDGIATHWSLGDYPGLAVHHPALVAGVLYRDFVRRRDDATVLVLRKGRR